MSTRLKPPYATVTDKAGTHIVGGSLELPELIRDSVWENIREQFTQEEKIELRKAITGHVICPKGVIIDAELLDVDLGFKLAVAIGEAIKKERA